MNFIFPKTEMWFGLLDIAIKLTQCLELLDSHTFEGS